MKKSKTQKGITMAALILTIIVLLILMAVAVSTVKEDDIIGHAQNEKDKAQQLETKYNELLVQQSNYLNYNPNDSFHGEHTFDEGTIITEATCTVEGKIEYTCTFEDCTYSYTDSIAALGHVLTPNGIHNEYNETYHTILNDCTRCGTTNIQNGLETHSFTNYVINSENGTKTAKCDKCSATNTITITVALSKTSGEVFENNTIMIDDYGNKLKVPAGFKIASDSATAVTDGVVIEDANYENTIGSQFVWVPVGNIKTSTSDTKGTTITLGRYTFDETDGTPTIMQPTEEYPYTSDEELNAGAYNLTEWQTTRVTYKAHARDIIAFYESTIENGGYYFGRYEAGNLNDILVCKAGQTVYNNVSQIDSSSLSQEMYGDGYTTGTFSSDLINSYAWDTALVFIQTFGGTNASNYANANNGNSFTVTGGNGDEYCKINDMSTNCSEWSTETYKGTWENLGWNCGVDRGGNFYEGLPGGNSSGRGTGGYTDTGWDFISFRPIIYLAK